VEFHTLNTERKKDRKKRNNIWTILKKISLFFFISIVLVISAEFIYFLAILTGTEELKETDLIVVFEGREERVRAAYELADLGYATSVLISPAGHDKLNTYDRMYKPRIKFDRVLETKARTTFENALFTSEIIKEKGYKSVILVTSWDHMPRSYLLLRLMLPLSDVKIRLHSVKTKKISRGTWFRTGLAWKMVYNEMIETLGSMVELIKYRISGRTFQHRPGKNQIFTQLKAWLLFDI
jgi:uncharacterized SAM-binding protein YcdF (DUF218 family)